MSSLTFRRFRRRGRASGCTRPTTARPRPRRHEHSWVDSAIENTLFAEFAVVAVCFALVGLVSGGRWPARAPWVQGVTGGGGHGGCVGVEANAGGPDPGC